MEKKMMRALLVKSGVLSAETLTTTGSVINGDSSDGVAGGAAGGASSASGAVFIARRDERLSTLATLSDAAAISGKKVAFHVNGDDDDNISRALEGVLFPVPSRQLRELSRLHRSKATSKADDDEVASENTVESTPTFSVNNETQESNGDKNPNDGGGDQDEQIFMNVAKNLKRKSRSSTTKRKSGTARKASSSNSMSQSNSSAQTSGTATSSGQRFHIDMSSASWRYFREAHTGTRITADTGDSKDEIMLKLTKKKRCIVRTRIFLDQLAGAFKPPTELGETEAVNGSAVTTKQSSSGRPPGQKTKQSLPPGYHKDNSVTVYIRRTSEGLGLKLKNLQDYALVAGFKDILFTNNPCFGGGATSINPVAAENVIAEATNTENEVNKDGTEGTSTSKKSAAFDCLHLKRIGDNPIRTLDIILAVNSIDAITHSFEEMVDGLKWRSGRSGKFSESVELDGLRMPVSMSVVEDVVCLRLARFDPTFVVRKEAACSPHSLCSEHEQKAATQVSVKKRKLDSSEDVEAVAPSPFSPTNAKLAKSDTHNKPVTTKIKLKSPHAQHVSEPGTGSKAASKLSKLTIETESAISTETASPVKMDRVSSYHTSAQMPTTSNSTQAVRITSVSVPTGSVRVPLSGISLTPTHAAANRSKTSFKPNVVPSSSETIRRTNQSRNGGGNSDGGSSNKDESIVMGDSASATNQSTPLTGIQQHTKGTISPVSKGIALAGGSGAIRAPLFGVRASLPGQRFRPQPVTRPQSQ
jgi:hypothetical protein